MIRKSVLSLASLCLLSCVCGTRKEIVASDTASAIDASTTAVLPPEVYGRYYKLQDVVRLDAQLQPIPRPADARRKAFHPQYISFTPGFSHIDYETPDINEDEVYFPGLPPFQEVYYKGHFQFWISDTTYIHPDDSIITTAHSTWNDLLQVGEWETSFQLRYADSSLLVIRAAHQKNYISTYDQPAFEEMYYRYIPQDSVHRDYAIMHFPTFEAADAFLIPLDGLSVREIGQRRNAPMVLQPDTIRCGTEGGRFTIETSNVFYRHTCAMSGVLSYEGAEHTDTLGWSELYFGKDYWLRLGFVEVRKFSVSIAPNAHPRGRRAHITIEGDNLLLKYHSIGRTPPSGTLVILQEGAKK